MMMMFGPVNCAESVGNKSVYRAGRDVEGGDEMSALHPSQTQDLIPSFIIDRHA